MFSKTAGGGCRLILSAVLFNANRFRFGGAAIELSVIMMILENLVVLVTL